MFEIHNFKILVSYDKNCWFYERAKLGYNTFKNGIWIAVKTSRDFNAWRQFLC